MKIPSLAAIAIAIACLATATPAKADNALTCNAADQGRRFELLLEPHDRYLQTTRIEIAQPSADLMRPFQETGESALAVSDASLHVELDPKGCTIDRTSRSHFVECANATDARVGRFHLSSLHFRYTGQSSLGASQTVSVDRQLDIVSVSLHAEVQTKQTIGQTEDRVVATLTVNARVGGQVRTLTVTRDLGEWTSRADRSDWDRCLATTR